MQIIKSPLNYIGGKYKLLPQILPLFPKNINRFVDLFAGGCNVGINVQANEVIFNDNLSYLIDLYNELQSKELGFTLSYIDSKIKEYNLSKTNLEGYNNLRKHYNKNRYSLDLFVLICFSFNNQIRFNNKHEFNISFGKDRSHFNDAIKQNLIKFIEKIQQANCKFSNEDFTNFNINDLTSDDFIYLDLPYLISTGSYNDGKRGFKGWTNKEELELYNLISCLIDKDVKFALSNVLNHKNKTNQLLIDFVKSKDLKVNFLDFNYINCNYQNLDRDSTKNIEVIITNY